MAAMDWVVPAGPGSGSHVGALCERRAHNMRSVHAGFRNAGAPTSLVCSGMQCVAQLR